MDSSKSPGDTAGTNTGKPYKPRRENRTSEWRFTMSLFNQHLQNHIVDVNENETIGIHDGDNDGVTAQSYIHGYGGFNGIATQTYSHALGSAAEEAEYRAHCLEITLNGYLGVEATYAYEKWYPQYEAKAPEQYYLLLKTPCHIREALKEAESYIDDFDEFDYEASRAYAKQAVHGIFARARQAGYHYKVTDGAIELLADKVSNNMAVGQAAAKRDAYTNRIMEIAAASGITI